MNYCCPRWTVDKTPNKRNSSTIRWGAWCCCTSYFDVLMRRSRVICFNKQLFRITINYYVSAATCVHSFFNFYYFGGICTVLSAFVRLFFDLDMYSVTFRLHVFVCLPSYIIATKRALQSYCSTSDLSANISLSLDMSVLYRMVAIIIVNLNT